MTKKIRAAFVSLLAILTLTFVPLATVGQAAAASNVDIGDCVAQGVDVDGNLTTTCNGDAAAGNRQGTNLTDVLTLVVNIISIIVGVVAVIMIIFGGLKYITSGGESSKITSAKNSIIYALIGLVVVALAQFIVRFVLAKATEVAN